MYGKFGSPIQIDFGITHVRGQFMGMFTRIKHPKTGEELQIYGGHDDLECYSVGDKVNWEIYPDEPGLGNCLMVCIWMGLVTIM